MILYRNFCASCGKHDDHHANEDAHVHALINDGDVYDVNLWVFTHDASIVLE